MESPTVAWTIRAALAVIAAYLPVGLYLQHTYVPRAAPIYARFGGGGFAFVMRLPDLDWLADSGERWRHPAIALLEDGKPLGPAHSGHQDIADHGHGRFSHWQGIGLIFSSSDNTDPNFNGRAYTIERPDER
jgi:hypothetical protein